MDDVILTALTEYGGLTGFAVFLVYLHFRMVKRFDSLTDSFQSQIAGLQSRHDAREDDIRTRYDAVITTYNKERDELIQGIGIKLDALVVEIKAGREDMAKHYESINAEFVRKIMEEKK
jgi:hypothetical protein